MTPKEKPVIAIVSMEDLEALNAIENQIDLEDVRKILANVKKHGTISLDAIKRKHDFISEKSIILTSETQS